MRHRKQLRPLGTTVACAGAVTPAAVAEVEKMGFQAIVNLRLATEEGADLEAEARAAEGSGAASHPPRSPRGWARPRRPR